MPDSKFIQHVRSLNGFGAMGGDNEVGTDGLPPGMSQGSGQREDQYNTAGTNPPEGPVPAKGLK
jgi:hypothetical protein